MTYDPSSSFNNPLIVAEGFDPWRLCDNNECHSYSGFTDYEDINRESIFSGFDIFYIDWEDCGADIRANAALLEEVINWVNENKTCSNANVVLGQSMGGLIARYCLCSMEERGVPHDTRLFISHDAPHMGVNVSPGLQYLYWDIRNIVNDNNQVWFILASALSSTFNIYYTLMNVGYYTSVRQMLSVYLNPSEVYSNSAYLVFQAELENKGFPKGDLGQPIENVTIVNGGGSAPGGFFNFYNPGDKLFHYYCQASSRFFVEAILAGTLKEMGLLWLPGRSTITYSYDVFPYQQNSTTARSMSLTFTKTLLWRVPLTIIIDQKTGNNPSSGIPFDGVSSSFYSPPGDIENNYNWSWGFPWNQIIGTFDYELSFAEKLQFVPTASALGYSGSYNQDFYRTSLSPRDDIPFDSYILNDTSSFHTSFAFDGIDGWLSNVLSEVHVPPVVFNGDTLKITGASLPFTWTSSNSSIATVADSIVHLVSDGSVEFTARVSGTGQAITKTRKAIVGFPAVTLSSDWSEYGYHTVRVTYPTIEKEQLVKDAVSQGILQYHWGVKTGNAQTVWRNNGSTIDTIHVCIPDSLDHVTVYMEWIHGNVHDTTSREVQACHPNIYYSNIDHIRGNPINGISIIENPVHSFPSITATYGHYCLIISGVQSATLPPITSITIEDETFPVTGVHYLPGYGSTAVLYVFDILNTFAFQELFILKPPVPSFYIKNFNVSLNGSNGPIQSVNLPYYWSRIPL